jgi:hypothetical protein
MLTQSSAEPVSDPVDRGLPRALLSACERAAAGQWDARVEFRTTPTEICMCPVTLGQADGITAIVLTEHWANPGRSITNAVGEAARCAHARLAPDTPIGDIIFIEHYGPVSYPQGNSHHLFDHVPIDERGMHRGGWRRIHSIALAGGARGNPDVAP